MDVSQHNFLSDEQVQQFLDDGVLVVDDVLSRDEISQSLADLNATLRLNGVESLSVDDEESAKSFSKLSSTNGSGGVLDLFYDPWKMEIATSPKLFSMTQQLWAASYCHSDESKESLSSKDLFRWHPFGSFDCTKGYVYIDRIGYRLPSELAQKIGDRLQPDRKKKARALQRSLTPHLDCCPNSFYKDSAKWRPIQSFVSLSDSLDPNTGGFEAAKGFHRDFHNWARNRAPTVITQNNQDGSDNLVSISAPCVGQYTHIRPKEDKDVMDRVKHVPVRAGSAVFWDNRIPHANAYKHNGASPRVVVYCAFLPDVELNRIYIQNQLSDFRRGKPPRDQWNHIDENYAPKIGNESILQSLTPLGRQLMGVDEWNER